MPTPRPRAKSRNARERSTASPTAPSPSQLDTDSKPLTGAQRFQRWRARQIEKGLTEVRGIYALPEQHKLVREAARTVLKR